MKIPRTIRLLPGRVELREPWPEEKRFFRSRPDISGLAAEDGCVVLNPYSPLDEQQLRAVMLNEAARVVMKRDATKLSFTLTAEQKVAFAEYGTEDDIRATIAARLLSGDPTALEPSKAQIAFARKLAAAMGLPQFSYC